VQIFSEVENLLPKDTEARKIVAEDTVSLTSTSSGASGGGSGTRRRLHWIGDKVTEIRRRKAAGRSAATGPSTTTTTSVTFRPGSPPGTPENETYNEHVIIAAKELGRQLFSDLAIEERKAKINEQIDKLHGEIDETTKFRLQLLKDCREALTAERKLEAEQRLNKLDEKLQSLAVLMLHVCRKSKISIGFEHKAFYKAFEHELFTAREFQYFEKP
jgi:hypothetical protein